MRLRMRVKSEEKRKEKRRASSKCVILTIQIKELRVKLMMKRLLVVCIFSGSIFAQNVSTQKNELDQNNTVAVGQSSKAVTGLIKEYYENGKVRSSIPYKGDKIDGIRKEYYESGKFIVKAPYKEGILNGVLKAYYISGKLRFEIPFKHNTVDGMLKEYYTTGKLKSETPFKDGRKDGMGKVYNETGKAKAALFKDDVYNDTIKIYSETDTLLIEITIEDGKVKK